MLFSRTGLHEVAVGGLVAVAEDLVSDSLVQRQILLQQRIAGSRRPVVVAVGDLDALFDEEPQHVRRQVDRQHDEVDPVVVVEHVDAQAGVVHRLALRPQ